MLMRYLTMIGNLIPAQNGTITNKGAENPRINAILQILPSATWK